MNSKINKNESENSLEALEKEFSMIINNIPIIDIKLSDEQEKIINTTSNIKIDAVAGSGKTTTILYMSMKYPTKNVMQITYNNLLKREVRKKAAKLCVENIQIHTYHSLAVKFYDPSAYTDEDKEYVQIHNNNIKKYVQKYDYEYKYYYTCNENVYWCKIYMVLNALKTNLYDYVIWMDSDTIIKNSNIDIGKILCMFSSDIFIGSDNNFIYGLINSGVFIIKNSTIGVSFLNDCVNYLDSDCINTDGTLKGRWAGSCYEQGVMNILINDKYYNYTTVLNNKIIFNYNFCSDDVFIMHLYASSPSLRAICFKSNNNSKT